MKLAIIPDTEQDSLEGFLETHVARGTNENTNGLIRQFFPKSTDFKKVTSKEVKRVQYLLNGRPRKALGFHTPYEKFSELLAEKGEALANELMLR